MRDKLNNIPARIASSARRLTPAPTQRVSLGTLVAGSRSPGHLTTAL